MSDKASPGSSGGGTAGTGSVASSSPPLPEDILKSVREQLATAASDVADAKRAAHNPEQKRDEDRSEIAKLIIWIFTAGNVLVLLLLILDGWVTYRWDTVTTQAADLLKSILLPVVTLILGYYFGQAGRG